MTGRDRLLQEIEQFIARAGMKPARFGVLCLNDSKFVFRLRNGKDVRMETAEKIRRFIADYEASHPLERRSEVAA